MNTLQAGTGANYKFYICRMAVAVREAFDPNSHFLSNAVSSARDDTVHAPGPVTHPL